jgi:hypothetical protein
MPNFNTKEMKIAFHRVKHTVDPLPKESVQSLQDALAFAIEKECDMNLLIAFDGFYLEPSDFHSIKSHLEEKYKVDFTTKLADVFLMRTEHEAVITVKMSGSSSMYNKPPAAAPQAKPAAPKSAPAPTVKPPLRAVTTKKKGNLEPASKKSKVLVTTPSKKRRYPGEDAIEKVEEYDEEPGALTQECFGLF